MVDDGGGEMEREDGAFMRGNLEGLTGDGQVFAAEVVKGSREQQKERTPLRFGHL